MGKLLSALLALGFPLQPVGLGGGYGQVGSPLLIGRQQPDNAAANGLRQTPPGIAAGLNRTKTLCKVLIKPIGPPGKNTGLGL